MYVSPKNATCKSLEGQKVCNVFEPDYLWVFKLEKAQFCTLSGKKWTFSMSRMSALPKKVLWTVCKDTLYLLLTAFERRQPVSHSPSDRVRVDVRLKHTDRVFIFPAGGDLGCVLVKSKGESADRALRCSRKYKQRNRGHSTSITKTQHLRRM